MLGYFGVSIIRRILTDRGYRIFIVRVCLVFKRVIHTKRNSVYSVTRRPFCRVCTELDSGEFSGRI